VKSTVASLASIAQPASTTPSMRKMTEEVTRKVLASGRSRPRMMASWRKPLLKAKVNTNTSSTPCSVSPW